MMYSRLATTAWFLLAFRYQDRLCNGAEIDDGYLRANRKMSESLRGFHNAERPIDKMTDEIQDFMSLPESKPSRDTTGLPAVGSTTKGGSFIEKLTEDIQQAKDDREGRLDGPSSAPTMEPTDAPTLSPSESPTLEPTAVPTAVPTESPTLAPTADPTESPTLAPTADPTESPSFAPSLTPTVAPISVCQICPGKGHCLQSPNMIFPDENNDQNVLCSMVEEYATVTGVSTIDCKKLQGMATKGVCGGCGLCLVPSASPTTTPSHTPSYAPSKEPTQKPTAMPSETPTMDSSNEPTSEPTGTPTPRPSPSPTYEPTHTPSLNPSSSPTLPPTVEPTFEPTLTPTEALISKCYICPVEGECLQSPFEIYPHENNKNGLTCVTVGEYIFNEGTTVADCIGVQGIVASGGCGGCGPCPEPTQTLIITSESPTSEPSQSPTGKPTESPTISPTVDPTLDPTPGPSLEQSVTPNRGTHVSMCQICPGIDECFQSPSMIFPAESNDPGVLCGAVEEYVAVNGVSTADCTALQDLATKGACGGCGLCPASTSASPSESAPVTKDPPSGRKLSSTAGRTMALCQICPSNDQCLQSPNMIYESNGQILLCGTMEQYIQTTFAHSTDCTNFQQIVASGQCGGCGICPDQGNLIVIQPSDSPSLAPSTSPTPKPSKRPTRLPTPSPIFVPTLSPTERPTRSPAFTFRPTLTQNVEPTRRPTSRPSLDEGAAVSPTKRPTRRPTVLPAVAPTFSPTDVPTDLPTFAPTFSPTGVPTDLPTFAPTLSPTPEPTSMPVAAPTSTPSAIPSMTPSSPVTESPTAAPTPVVPESQFRCSLCPAGQCVNEPDVFLFTGTCGQVEFLLLAPGAIDREACGLLQRDVGGGLCGGCGSNGCSRNDAALLSLP
jgi:hypothetical protein